MANEKDLAILSLHVYEVDRNQNNAPFVNGDWTVLNPRTEGSLSFAYAVYQNTISGKIVIAYRGTDGGVGDWLTNTGLTFSQESQAAKVYAQVVRDYDSAEAGANISFTGHSLGGGLAATMAVWFNRPAIVFDPAPSQAAATSLLVVQSVKLLLGSSAPQSFLDYASAISTGFQGRESQVTSYSAPGSIVYSSNFAFNTITGAGQSNTVQFGTANMGSVAGRADMHSQALLTAGLLTTSFPTATVAVQAALPLIMNKSFYALPTSGDKPNFLIDLIRSEQANPANGKLSHFSADLNKLGTNIAGLNAAAQNAMIAQGIEWYYWQDKNYSGVKEFFTKTGELLQYTTAQGDGLLGAQNKSSIYTTGWLAALQNANGAAYSPTVRVNYDQWNIAAGSTGTTATAKDDSKSQVFAGSTSRDIFTGGNKADTFLAGAGNDELNGGLGNVFTIKDFEGGDLGLNLKGFADSYASLLTSDSEYGYYYKFRSCLRPYLLVKKSIRYRKTACHARVMCLRTQNSAQSRLERSI